MLKKIFLSLLPLFFLIPFSHASSHSDAINSKRLKNHTFLEEKERKKIKDYLLPSTHPIFPILDTIFQAQRATQDEDSLVQAGFNIKFSQPRSFIKVVSHPLLPGYLIKLYLDSELRLKWNRPGWKWLVARVEGANSIRDYIKYRKFKYFVAPKKWVYLLPLEPSPLSNPHYTRKNEILVVEDMQLVSEEENRAAWKEKITTKHLDEFFDILTFNGGSSYRADNVVYTKNGKFAFIDTEYPHKTPNYKSIKHYLSPEMAKYWKSKLKRNGLD